MRQADESLPELPIDGDPPRPHSPTDSQSTGSLMTTLLITAAVLIATVAGLGRGDRADRSPEAPLDPAPTAAPIEAVVSESGPWEPGEMITVTVPWARALSVRQCVTPDAERTSIWASCDIYTGGHYQEQIFTSETFGRGGKLNAEGLVELDVPVFRRLVLGDRSIHDCVTDGPCELVIVSWTGDDVYAPIPVDFVAGVAPIGEPRVTVDVGSQLSHGQTVTVTVSNLAGAHDLDVQLCPRDTPTTVVCATLASRELDGADKETLVLALPRAIRHPLTGDLHDCADRCALRATTGRVAADVTVTFVSEVVAP